MTRSTGVGRGKNPASWSNTKRGKDHHRWNDRRIVSSHGYIKVRAGIHPLADPNGYVYEHLLVWCAAGNPKPAHDEVLHHINEDKTDNRLSNLRLMNRGLHTIEEHVDRDPIGKFCKKTAGRSLDGIEHNGYPVVA